MRDARLTPARPDLAARFLQGEIDAACYVDGETLAVSDPIAPVRSAPAPDASMLTQALRGERVTIYDRPGGGWAWGQLESDGYVGWIPETALAPPGVGPTHSVIANSTFGFPGPSIKLPPRAMLPMGAAVAIARTEGAFAVSNDDLHIPSRHLQPLGVRQSDFVAVAERFVGTPYLWGGKTSLGTDCSGLVQVALNACGVACPRDSDMQQNALGAVVRRDAVARGDLMFWKGHVAIARDEATIVHANAHHMATAIEPIANAIARIAAEGSELLAVKRLSPVR